MKKRFKLLIVVFLIVLNISFLIPPKKSEAIIPLVLPIAYTLGTALLTAGGYYLVSSGALDPACDVVANGIVNSVEGGVRVYENGKIFISRQAMEFTWDKLVKTYSQTIVDNHLSDYINYEGGYYKVTYDGLSAGTTITLPGIFNGEVVSYTYGSRRVSTAPGNSDLGVIGIVIDSINSTTIGAHYTYKRYSTGAIVNGNRNDFTWDKGKTIDFSPRNYYNPSFDIDRGSVSAPGWKDTAPKDLDAGIPIGLSIPAGATDAGYVFWPKTANPTYDTWNDVTGVGDIAIGTGSIAQDGTLTDSFPVDGTDNPSIPGTIPSDWTVPNKLELDFSPLYVATNKFPFCLPFDVYNLIKSFETTRKAPVFTVSFSKVAQVTGVGGGEFSIDFGNEQFSKIVLIFRTFVLFAFCIMLAFKTKSIMGW